MRRLALSVLAVLVAMSGCATSTAPDAAQSPSGAAQSRTFGDIGAVPPAALIEQARADVSSLDTPRLAAQLVVPRRENDVTAAADLMREYGFGGVVLFSEHVPTDPSTVVATITEANAAITTAMGEQRPWPAYIGVDQEGGPIQRIGPPLTQFPAAMALGAADDPQLAHDVGVASGSQLRALGFTAVLAPDADVTAGASDPTIGVRSPGSDPALVARTATALARGYADAGIVSTAKHFPGHGSVSGDTHLGQVHQSASRSALTSRDLVPFAQLAQAGAPAIMTAHIVVDAIDADRPATYSPQILTELLRTHMGFGGLIVTDALDMGAAAEGAPAGQGAVQAIEAGADVLLMPSDPRAAVTALTQAVEDGRLSRDRLVDSAARMVATLRFAQQRATTDPAPAGSHEQLAREVARASITQLSGRCGANLVGRSMSISGGSQADRAALTAAAAQAGVSVSTRGTPVTLIAGSSYRAAEGDDSSATADGSAASAAAGGTGVVVALDVPYPLAQAASSGAATVATYGRTATTMAGLVEVLTGKHAAAGKAPVPVGSLPLGAGCGGRS